VRTERVLAVLLSTTVLAAIVSIAFPPATLAAGATAVLAALVALPLVRAAVRAVIAVLVLAGIAGMVAGSLLGHPPDIRDAAGSLNQDLIAMLAAVTFVRLVIPQVAPSAAGLRGWPAVFRTVFAVHLLGSVINMSAVTLAAHRLGKKGRLALPDALLISRGYAAGAFWSPFWLASAATLAYLPGADTLPALLAGAAVTVVALLLGGVDAGRLLGDARTDYRGYALAPRLLVVPLAMVVIVLVGHLLLPDVRIPRLVALSAVVVTIVGLLAARRGRLLLRHAGLGTAGIRAEAALFLAAGVLTIGLDSLVGAMGPLLPLDHYDVLVAWLCLLGTVALALVGLHPIVTLALVTALVLPLDPDPSLFLLATLLGWGAASSVGVTSGLLMHLTSQFAVPLRAVVTRNLVFVAIVALLALPTLWLIDSR
jgi:hypothetical protein